MSPLKSHFSIVLSLFALLYLGLVSCNVQVPKDPYTLLYHLRGEPDTLNPLTGTDAYSSRILGLIFDSLIERDNDTLEFIPKIAKRWTISPDKLIYTFYMHQNVKWQDGSPMTADDVIYSYQRLMDPKVDSAHLKSYYRDISQIRKINDYTIEFTYARPYFRALSFVGGIPIFPKHIYEKGEDFNSHPAGRHPIGNGPYKFVEWKTGKHILLERNEEYWDQEKLPHIKKIRFKMVPDDTIALQVLKKGELDITTLRPIQWVRQTSSKKFNQRFVKHRYYVPGYRYIGWNLRKPQFQDRMVRRALTHLVNRKAIVDKLEYGLGKLTTGPFWVFNDEYDQNIKPIPFDPEAAKQLLNEAGWIDRDGDGIREKDGIPFEFTFLLPAGVDFYQRLGTIMKKDFEKAGITLNIQTMEWSAFVARLNGRNFDAVSLAWSASFEEDPYQIWHSSQIEKGSNYIGFSHGEADQIMEKARTIFDKKKRVKLLKRFHQIMHEEQPYTFLYTGPALVARDKRFKNVKVYRGGIDILEWRITKD